MWLPVDSCSHQQIYAKIFCTKIWVGMEGAVLLFLMEGAILLKKYYLSLYNQNISGLYSVFWRRNTPWGRLALWKFIAFCQNWLKNEERKNWSSRQKASEWPWGKEMRGKNQDKIKVVKMSDGQNRPENFIHGKTNVYISIHLSIWLSHNALDFS